MTRFTSSSQSFDECHLDPYGCYHWTALRLVFRENPLCSHHRTKEVELILQDCLRQPSAKADIVGPLDPVEALSLTNGRHLKTASRVAAISASTDRAREVESRVGPNRPIGAFMRASLSSRKPAFRSASSRL